MKLSETIVYARGRFCTYAEAHVGLLTHGLQYGTGCFEGIRGYWDGQERELYLLQLKEHFERLETSARILTMRLPHSVSELSDIAVELCRRNNFETDAYIRPFMYKSEEDIGVRLHDVPEELAIVPVPFTRYLDGSSGLRTCVSSWRRVDDACAPPRAKITGLYVNSALAKSEAHLNGFDEAIMLSADGHVSEGSAENIFLVRNGVLYTPDPSQNILEGCTRRSVLHIAREHFNIPIVERAIDRGELYAAQEIFFTGTAVGIVHVGSVDHRPVGDGSIGPVTRKIEEFYARIVRGAEPRYRHWLTTVYGARRAPVVSVN